MKLHCYNGLEGLDPAGLVLDVDDAVGAGVAALQPGDSPVEVTDLNTGKRYHVASTSCGEPCHCALRAIPAVSGEHDSDHCAYRDFFLRELEKRLTAESRFDRLNEAAQRGWERAERLERWNKTQAAALATYVAVGSLRDRVPSDEAVTSSASAAPGAVPQESLRGSAVVHPFGCCGKCATDRQCADKCGHIRSERNDWIKLFNRLDAAVSRHRRKEPEWADTYDEALAAAHDKILKAAANSGLRDGVPGDEASAPHHRKWRDVRAERHATDEIREAPRIPPSDDANLESRKPHW